MMKKIIIISAGIVALGIVYWLASPLFITKTVNEDLPVRSVEVGGESVQENSGSQAEEFPVKIILQGSFSGRGGHNASGTAKIIEAEGKRYVRFEGDFKVTNGPDLFVYFGRNGEYEADAQLGPLKGNEGSQNYEIPSGMDIADFDEVWVWCRAFSVPFGVAELR